MTGRDCDIAIAGGGLAGGLIALALARHRPDMTFRLVEAGLELGGNHRWSWFASDLKAPAQDLLQPVHTNRWPAGNQVIFPGHRRQLGTPYCSIGSADFAAALHRDLPQGTIMTGRTVAAIDARGLTLADGERIGARTVIDARGFVPSPHVHGGWQVFMGRHLRVGQPHGLERPIIMDASVEQLGGYRFVYVLPLGVDELFVEDTYYQDTPALDRGALAARIDAYCAAQGWTGETLGEETGVLPVITGGNHQRYFDQVATPGVALAGARGLFTHPLTSYTLPFATQVALAVAEKADLPGEQMAAHLADLSRRHWAATGFYRLLGTMLFGAAEPHRRVAIFERFYRLPEPLVERFYTGRSTLADKACVLVGKPPVPVTRAIRALASTRPPLLPQTESLNP
ncbi:lycopene beta-cyclase CrtY [Alteraurantiacibacter buctensis]|uniref:Lycopene beta-cyclase CrtY n=1 Tax=Alteraurantiacibacter buctensis TaxID=1503981 RepID=A0A844Z5P6_9SPHN|nr:lycopene beta-cyclase CrtY [Alteraurantiacibacter buctensis]MXO73133.1 lycopene beta-cyclase CrtY [Alteraurantiacibacter buctensis]